MTQEYCSQSSNWDDVEINGFAEAMTTYGLLGVKVWIYKGDVIKDHEEIEAAAVAATQAVSEATPAAVTAAA